MKFVEMTQDVQIARPNPIKLDIGLTPGRRKANKIFKAAINNLNDPKAEKLKVDFGSKLLEEKIQKRKLLREDERCTDVRYEDFRLLSMQLEEEIMSYKKKIATIKTVLKQERQKIQPSENKNLRYERSIDELNRKLNDRGDQLRTLQKQLNQKQIQLLQKELEKKNKRQNIQQKWQFKQNYLNKKIN